MAIKRKSQTKTSELLAEYRTWRHAIRFQMAVRRKAHADRLGIVVLSTLTVQPYHSFYPEDGVQLGPLGTGANNRPIVPAPGDYDDEEIGEMLDRGNRSTRRKPAPMLCPPQTPYAARTRTRTAAVGSQRLTA
jgi:hypothetical protein